MNIQASAGGATKYRTGPNSIRDVIDQTPHHTGGLDTLSQRGYRPTTLP